MTMASTRKPTLRAVNSPVPVYQLHIELKYLKPAVWRRVLVPASIKLPKLHVVLLWAMGWDGGHLHEFVFGDINYGVPDPDFPSDPPMLNEARVSLGQGARCAEVIHLYLRLRRQLAASCEGREGPAA